MTFRLALYEVNQSIAAPRLFKVSIAEGKLQKVTTKEELQNLLDSL